MKKFKQFDGIRRYNFNYQDVKLHVLTNNIHNGFVSC